MIDHNKWNLYERWRSFLIFYLVTLSIIESRALKSATIVVELSISSVSSVIFCFMYFGAMFLSLLLFIFIYVLSAPHSLQDLSSPVRNRSCTLCSGECGVLTTGLPMILDAFMFVIVKSSWWIDPFIIIKFPSLSLATFLC